MSDPHEEQYELEDILAEFSQDGPGKPKEAPPKPEPPVPPPADPLTPPPNPGDPVQEELREMEIISAIRREVGADEPEDDALKMLRTAQEKNQKAQQEPKRKPLVFPGARKREAPAEPEPMPGPAKTPEKPEKTEKTVKSDKIERPGRHESAPEPPAPAQKPEPEGETILSPRQAGLKKTPPRPAKPMGEKGAPWRTTPQPGDKRPAPPVPEEPGKNRKAPPRLRTVDLEGSQNQPRLRFAEDEPLPPAPDLPEEEEERPRRPKKRIPYDRINVPCDDAAQMATRLGKRLGGMAARMLLLLPVIVLSAYMAAAERRGLPMPFGFTREAFPLYYDGAFAFLALLTLILPHEVTGAGLWRLGKGRPTLDTLAALGSLVTLAGCVTGMLLPAWRQGTPFVCVNALTVLFALLSKRQRVESLRRNYKAITMGGSPVGVKLYSDGKIQNMAVKTQSGVDVELPALAEPDLTEKYAGVYAPLALVLSAALTAAVCAAGDITRSLWCLSAVLSVSAPVCLLLSSSAGGKRLGKKLYTSGSMLVNARCGSRLAKCRRVALRDADLYPAGAVKITGMKIAENQEPEIVVGCAASLLQEVGGGLARAFTEFARQQYIVPNKARELRFFDTRGICATVSGKYVQLGTASYLMRMGVQVTEGLRLKNSIFVAIDSQFAGIFSMRYEAQPPVYAAFGLLRQSHIRPVLALRDTTQTQSQVESRFDLRRDSTFMPELEERLDYSAPSFGREEETLAVLSRDGLMPMAEVLSAARKGRRSAIWGIVLGSICALGGMLILAFLTGKGAFEAADPINVLVYLLLWALPAKLIRGIVNRL